jgi:hypothetical protein
MSVEDVRQAVIAGLARLETEESATIAKHAQPARFAARSTVVGTFRPTDGTPLLIVDPFSTERTQ